LRSNADAPHLSGAPIGFSSKNVRYFSVGYPGI